MTELSAPLRWRYGIRPLLEVALAGTTAAVFGGWGWAEEPSLWPLWLAMCALVAVYLFHLLAMLMTRIEIGTERLSFTLRTTRSLFVLPLVERFDIPTSRVRAIETREEYYHQASTIERVLSIVTDRGERCQVLRAKLKSALPPLDESLPFNEIALAIERVSGSEIQYRGMVDMRAEAAPWMGSSMSAEAVLRARERARPSAPV